MRFHQSHLLHHRPHPYKQFLERHRVTRIGYNYSYIQLQCHLDLINQAQRKTLPEPGAGQHRANSVQSSLTARQVQKQARRQAHALRLERAKLGQQVVHSFAAVRSLRIHKNDPMPPPDFWYQLKRHPEREASDVLQILRSNHAKIKRPFN